MTDVQITIMSGVDDGQRLTFSSDNGDGRWDDAGQGWVISVGRQETNDIFLQYDNFASRFHAEIIWQDLAWWLNDCQSTNGTFVEQPGADDARVYGTVPIQPGALFRIGHTWLRIDESTP